MAGHTHGATSGRGLWLSLGLTGAFVAVEAYFGQRAHSLALISDAGHNVSDALALGLAAYAVWVARRPASPGKTFGYHRVAILTALANAAALVVIALGILVGAWAAFRHPEPVQGNLMIWVAAAGVFMNTVIAWQLQGASKHSLNARAAYVHMAGDALSSLGVVIAGFLIKTMGWTLADPLVSVLIAVFILHSSWGIIGEATNILMEGTPKGLEVDALVAAIRATPPVRDVHDMHVWTVSDGLHFLSCHIILPGDCTVSESQSIVAILNKRLYDEFGIGHATIQTETAEGDTCRIAADALYCALHPSHDHAGCSH
ncbi:MAG: cation diffusion facilitator family transporter [Janthinobacterium lividum]